MSNIMDNWILAYFKENLRFLAITLLPALCLVLTPIGDIPGLSLITHGFSLIDTMFHELGHTLTAWSFGYPALPSFDFEHGGGMSYYFARSWLLQAAVFGAALYGCYLLYDDLDRRLCFTALGGIILWMPAAVTDFHNVIIGFMGHGGAILTGSFFILRSLMGWTEKRPGEKWISAFAGYFMIFSNMKLSWKLIFDIDYQEEYWNQKGSHGFGDFSRVADYLWFTSEAPVAWFCLFLCAVFLILPHGVAYMVATDEPEI